MTTPVFSVRLGAPVTEAAALLASGGFAAVPVVAAEVMSTPVTAVSPGTDVVTLRRTMLETGVRAFPVVDGCRLVGIVTRQDIARAATPTNRAWPRRVPSLREVGSRSPGSSRPTKAPREHTGEDASRG